MRQRGTSKLGLAVRALCATTAALLLLAAVPTGALAGTTAGDGNGAQPAAQLPGSADRASTSASAASAGCGPARSGATARGANATAIASETVTASASDRRMPTLALYLACRPSPASLGRRRRYTPRSQSPTRVCWVTSCRTPTRRLLACSRSHLARAFMSGRPPDAVHSAASGSRAPPRRARPARRRGGARRR